MMPTRLTLPTFWPSGRWYALLEGAAATGAAAGIAVLYSEKIVLHVQALLGYQ
jgi:hypothetical protein